MSQEIKFPIMDMTEFVFEADRVFFSFLSWEPEYTLKENDVNRIAEWKYIDSDGKILKVEIVKKKKLNSFFSFLYQPSYELELQLVNTGKVFQLEELKKLILLKKDKMFHVNYNKTITQSEYETKIKNAESFLEVIDVASFEDYKYQ